MFYIFYEFDRWSYIGVQFYFITDVDLESFKIDFFGFFSVNRFISSFIIAYLSSESSVPVISMTSKLPNFTFKPFCFFDYFYFSG